MEVGGFVANRVGFHGEHSKLMGKIRPSEKDERLGGN